MESLSMFIQLTQIQIVKLSRRKEEKAREGGREGKKQNRTSKSHINPLFQSGVSPWAKSPESAAMGISQNKHLCVLREAVALKHVPISYYVAHTSGAQS